MVNFSIPVVYVCRLLKIAYMSWKAAVVFFQLKWAAIAFQHSALEHAAFLFLSLHLPL